MTINLAIDYSNFSKDRTIKITGKFGKQVVFNCSSMETPPLRNLSNVILSHNTFGDVREYKFSLRVRESDSDIRDSRIMFLVKGDLKLRNTESYRFGEINNAKSVTNMDK